MNNSMNRRAITGTALKRALLAKLQEILSEIGWRMEPHSPARQTATPGGPDARFLVEARAGVRVELQVHIKSELRPGIFESWVRSRRLTRSRRVAIPVLAVPSISERLAELCRGADWSWYDLAGNCWIDAAGLLHIERSGYPPAFRPPRATANLSTPAVARVIRALLTPEHAALAWKQRDLLEKTVCREIVADHPVSLGLVNKVIRHLREEGFVEKTEDRRVRLRDPMGLLQAWREAYRFDRHERHRYFTLTKGKQLDGALDRAISEVRGLAAYAAFSAAEHQAPHVRQARTWIYVAGEALDTVVGHTGAKEVESGENLIILVPDDLGVFVSFSDDGTPCSGERRPHCTDPVQTYVDLRHCGGRGEEAAQAVLEQKLLPAWKGAGFA